jgi:DNA-binding transcriptional LysR family regulator
VHPFNLARFNIVSLRLAVLCVQTGNLTAAAEKTNLALAAASRRINELEGAIGTTLFTRHARGLEPTAAGKVFYARGLAVLQTLERLSDELDDLAKGYNYHIHMLASSAALIQFLPQLIAQYGQIEKSIHIDIQEDVSSAVARGVQSGQASIGVFIEGPDTTGLRLWKFATDELVLAVPRGHRLAKSKSAIPFEEALDEDWITLETGAALLQLQTNAANTAKRPLKIRTQVRSFDAVCKLVGAGLGVALLPRVYFRDLKSAQLQIRPLKNTWAKRQVLLATRQLETDQRVLALVEFLTSTSQNAKPRARKQK